MCAATRDSENLLSVVVPVLDEEASIALLFAELRKAIEREQLDYEVIYVDDGSTDGTWAEIQKLTEQHDTVVGLRFRTMFGKAEALSAGFDYARGEMIVTIDGDLQDDPNDLPLLLARFRQGYHVVSGWKRERKDPKRRIIGSRIFNWLVSIVTGVKLHDHNCGFKLYDAEVFREIRLYGGLHRFVPVLAAARGFKVTEVAINHRTRPFGKSRYGFGRIPRGLLDLATVRFLTSFGQRPQHLLGISGLCTLAIGALGLAWLIAGWFISRANWAAEVWPGIEPIHLHTRPVFYLAIAAMILGAQLMSMGFLAEMFVAFQRRDPACFSICETTGDATVSPKHIYAMDSPDRRVEHRS